MWKLTVGGLVIILVVLFLLGPKFYLRDFTHACGIKAGSEEKVASQSCYCMGPKSIQLGENNDGSVREFCQGYGVSFSR